MTATLSRIEMLAEGSHLFSSASALSRCSRSELHRLRRIRNYANRTSSLFWRLLSCFANKARQIGSGTVQRSDNKYRYRGLINQERIAATTGTFTFSPYFEKNSALACSPHPARRLRACVSSPAAPLRAPRIAGRLSIARLSRVLHASYSCR